MVGGDICLLMGWQCLNWLRRGEDGDVADIVPCGRCDLKVNYNNTYISIHAPRMGSDMRQENHVATRVYFNPRSPDGERLLEM